jgi:hypothetical protein
LALMFSASSAYNEPMSGALGAWSLELGAWSLELGACSSNHTAIIHNRSMLWSTKN